MNDFPMGNLGRDTIDLKPRPDLSWLFRTRIHGIEVTQSIQYFDADRHLTDPADRMPNNAVTLVGRKPALVRVFIRRGWISGPVTVTGVLTVYKRELGFLYRPVATLTPRPPGTVSAQPDPGYASERGNLSQTLNFLLPASLMCGNLRLIARIDVSDGSRDEWTEDVDVTLRQTLRLRSIPISYNGPTSTAPGAPTLSIPAPTLADLQTTSAWALNAFPVESTGSYGAAGTMAWNRPLSDAPSCAGCCTPNWVALNAQVAAQVTLDGSRTDVIYYGLLPNGIPIGPIIGCESSGVSAGQVGDGVTLAHEVGHHCGMPHAPCGGVGTPDPTYPAYEPYDTSSNRTASIGEYATDVVNGAIMSPAMFKDMMSYCGPRWISLHNYGRLINHTLLDPRRECLDHWWWRDVILRDRVLIPEKWLPDPPPDGHPNYNPVVQPERAVSVIGVLHGRDKLEVTSVMTLETRLQQRGSADTGLVAEVVGEDGTVLASASVRRLGGTAAGCGCGGGCVGGAGEKTYPAVVQALVPLSADLSDRLPGARAITVRRGRTELFRRERPGTTRRVPRVKAQHRDGLLQLTWAAADSDTEVWAQWSGDGGETWDALATGLRGGVASIDVSSLPGGSVQVRLLLGDGFSTVTTRPSSVRIPTPARTVSILAPTDGQTFVAGMDMRLWGAVTPTPGADDELGVRWLVDGDVVADELDSFVVAPTAGRHTLVLDVRGRGGRTRAETSFVTISLEQQGDEQ